MTEQEFDAICEEIMIGSSIRVACEAVGPSPRAFTLYLSKNPSKVPQYVRAREFRADDRFEKLEEVLARMTLPKVHPNYIDPQTGRVLMDAIKWQTAMEAPKRYGTKVDVTSDGRPVPGFTLVAPGAAVPAASTAPAVFVPQPPTGN